jgi:hypothetical protein
VKSACSFAALEQAVCWGAQAGLGQGISDGWQATRQAHTYDLWLVMLHCATTVFLHKELSTIAWRNVSTSAAAEGLIYSRHMESMCPKAAQHHAVHIIICS